METRNHICAIFFQSSYLNKYDQIKNKILIAIKNNIEFTVETSKNFADKKNHIIIITHAKNSQYSVIKLFTLFFNDKSPMLYTNVHISNIKGISHRYHNHIA